MLHRMIRSSKSSNLLIMLARKVLQPVSAYAHGDQVLVSNENLVFWLSLGPFAGHSLPGAYVKQGEIAANRSCWFKTVSGTRTTKIGLKRSKIL
jgi:hypothetical protein